MLLYSFRRAGNEADDVAFIRGNQRAHAFGKPTAQKAEAGGDIVPFQTVENTITYRIGVVGKIAIQLDVLMDACAVKSGVRAKTVAKRLPAKTAFRKQRGLKSIGTFGTKDLVLADDLAAGDTTANA